MVKKLRVKARKSIEALLPPDSLGKLLLHKRRDNERRKDSLDWPTAGSCNTLDSSILEA
jgi:hypothetical protein